MCSLIEYERVTDAIFQLPAGVEHLVVQLGIPIAYPRMNFLEYVFCRVANWKCLARFGRQVRVGVQIEPVSSIGKNGFVRYVIHGK